MKNHRFLGACALVFLFPQGLVAKPTVPSVAIPAPGPEDTTRDVSSTFVLPSQVVEFIVPPSRGRPVPPASGGKLEPAGRNRWRWTAPAAPGLYPIRIPALKRESFHVLNAFVQVPFRQIRNGRLNGYRIGSYPPPRGPAYQRPEGFVEVTPGNQDTWVSPSFQLKQFLCKQPGGFPKYLVLRPALLAKLESILKRARQKGYAWETLFVMSGYRTPHYNRSLGNVSLSRHMYGDAADVFVDLNPRDGSLDDLNGDGKVDIRDAYVLFDLAAEAEGPSGGLGTYQANAFHGPFLHVDTRGKPARWGVPRPPTIQPVVLPATNVESPST